MKRLSRCVLAVLYAALALATPAARHDKWVEVRSPNFVVVCNAGEKEARKTALQFEQIRAVFRQSIAVAGAHPTPLITVLAAKDDDTMRELLPEDWVKGHVHHSGLFVYRADLYFAAVELGQEGSNAYETLYHEYYHSVTLPYFPDLPLWLAEGLAEFYGHTHIEDKFVGMGQADADLLQELRSNSLIPLNVLFHVDQSSPYYNEANKTSIFYAESWALTHYLMIGDREAHRPMMVAYLKAIDQGKPQDQAAAEAFGDLKKMEGTLDSYVRNGAFFYLKIPAPAKVTDSDLKVRTLSEAEAEAYRGGFAAVRGRSDDAKTILEGALRLDPNVALADEYLGFTEFFDGQHDQAIESLAKAVALNPKEPFARYMRARFKVFNGGVIRRDPEIEEDLRQAIALNPDFPPPYGLLAIYMAAQNEDLPDALSFAQKAVALEPANSEYQLALAQVLVRMDKYDDANTAASKAAAWARRPDEKTNAATFMTFLQQARQFHQQVAGSQAAEEGEAADSADLSNSAGPWSQASGVAANSDCTRGFKLDVTTDKGTLHLREGRGTLNLVIEGGAIPHFSQCTSLNGLRVEVEYRRDEESGDSGTMHSLRVFAPSQEPKLPPGMAAAEGKVAGVTCKGNDMRLTLATHDKPLVFHSNDYTKITYLAGANSSLGDLEPCSELKGRAVTITYAVSNQKQFAGDMRTILVGK